MNPPIRLGVFGLGQVYRQLYAPAVAIRRDFCVAATADPAVPADFSQPEALLAGAEVDAILVLSPPPLHARHVALALDRGLPVLVEKPPALTVAEAEDWPNPVLLTCAFSRRYWKQYPGSLGRGHNLDYRLQTSPEAWGAKTVETVERDLLPHAADLAGWLSGEAIATVEGVTRTAGRASGTFVFESGRCFTWDVSHGGGYAESLAIGGRAVPDPARGPLAGALRRLRREPTPAVAAVASLLGDWAESLAGRPLPALAGLESARSCARVIEAVERVPSSASK